MNDTSDTPMSVGGDHRWPRTRWLVGAGAIATFVIAIAVVALNRPAQLSADRTHDRTSRSSRAARSASNPDPTAALRADNTKLSTRCPWLDTAMDRRNSPVRLAADVVRRMTTTEKLGEIVLRQSGGYENLNAGVARLCIPPLTLQDGPQGVAFGAVGVTRLPSPLALAATFDTRLARSYGQVMGAEAAGQGFDAIQGPNLNIDRVPQNGRSYETFGEDPTLVAEMGVAEIEGIQSQGTMAVAKHLVAYSQETDRGQLDEVVSQRALKELYLPPFAAAVRQAHVSAIMCAYPRLNGVFQCQDSALDQQLNAWGFKGLLRSDLGAVHQPVAALDAGVDLIKPARTKGLADYVRAHLLSIGVIDAAVTRILTAQFAHHLVGRAPLGTPGTPVDRPAHARVALTTAERATVLLKNSKGILPLSRSDRSVAVIGADARSSPVTTGYGSSRVIAPFVSLPIAAIGHQAGRGVRIVYANGGSTTAPLAAIPPSVLSPAVGSGHGLTLTLVQKGGGQRHASTSLNVPDASIHLRPHPTTSPLLPGTVASNLAGTASARPLFTGLPRRRSPADRHLPQPDVVLPAGWSNVFATWSGTLTPPRSGLYTLSLQGSGAATLTLDGRPAVADTLNHAFGRWSQTVRLTAGHHYVVRLDWNPMSTLTPAGETRVDTSSLTLGWQYVGGRIASAVAAARKAKVAVVFAGDFTSEAFDRPSLSLPGDENDLISAVAAANPHTVVVLNTGGPVLMPWLHQVAAVVENWYPGEQDGKAIAAVLYGAVDPSGHLPVTFPASAATSAIHSQSQWPGIGLVANYSEGLDVGYRYDHATGTVPLFPFGFGLSYTTFALSNLVVTRTATGFAVKVDVTDTGSRSGTALPQVYLTFPAAAAEPPAQLVAFAPTAVGVGQTRQVILSVPDTALRAYLSGSWTTVPGTYTLSVGQSSSSLPLSAAVSVP
ncbi:MAG: glycoside hydrolase family 3 C-terminal domain-containing protein [Acidimicrobiales bacterium]